MIELTLYSRPECHLCEVMLAELKPLLGERAAVAVVDISQEAELERKYGLSIPVLAADGEELCRYHLDAARVEAYLSRQGRRAVPSPAAGVHRG